jgi:hypothetical protein
MSKIGAIKITWTADGAIQWNLDFKDKDPDQLYSLGAVALTDHMMATLTSPRALEFCETVLRAMKENKADIAPIGAELQSASLEFHKGQVLYTKFSTASKFLANNDRLEAAISQMARNYVAKALATESRVNQDAITFGIIGVLATYEMHLREALQTHQAAATTRVNILRGLAVFINKYPYGIRQEDLQKHVGDIDSLIAKWKSLPLTPNKSFLEM